IGLGVHLGLAADFTLAVRTAFLALPEAAMGLPEVMCQRLLEQHLGRHRALAVTVLGESLPAEEAAAAGLIGRIVPDAAALETAMAALLERLLALDRAVLMASKRELRTRPSRFDSKAQLAAVAALP